MRFGGLDRIIGEAGHKSGFGSPARWHDAIGRVQRRIEANLGLPHAISVGFGDRAGKLTSGRGSHDGCVTTGAERHHEQFCTNLLELAVVAGHHINPGEPPDFSSRFGDHSLAVTAFQIRRRIFDDEMTRGGHKTTLRRASYHLLRGKPAISEEFVRNLLSAGLGAWGDAGDVAAKPKYAALNRGREGPPAEVCSHVQLSLCVCKAANGAQRASQPVAPQSPPRDAPQRVASTD